MTKALTTLVVVVVVVVVVGKLVRLLSLRVGGAQLQHVLLLLVACVCM